MEVDDDNSNAVHKLDVNMEEDTNWASNRCKGCTCLPIISWQLLTSTRTPWVGHRERERLQRHSITIRWGPIWMLASAKFWLNIQILLSQQFSCPCRGAGPVGTMSMDLPSTMATLPPLKMPAKKKQKINKRDFRHKVENAQTWYQQKGTRQDSGIGNNEGHMPAGSNCPSKRLKVFGITNLCGSNADRVQCLVS